MRKKRWIKDFLVMLRLKLNHFKRTTPYTGPLFDAMHQINGKITADMIKETMDRAGVYRMCLFARQQEPHDATLEVEEIKRQLGDAIVLGAPKRFDSRDDIRADFRDYLIALLQRPEYQFIGELQCTHADKYPYEWGNEHTLAGERWFRADAPNMMELAASLANTGKPIYVHWEAYNWERDWPSFNRLFGENPDTLFVWPHGGYAYPKYINEVMQRHRNVYVTISKRDMFYFDHKWRTYKGTDVGSYGLQNLDWQDRLGSSMQGLDGNIQGEWYHLLRRFPNRFLFAIDAHKRVRWEYYCDAVENFRMILGQLPDDLAQDIAWRNAERLFGKFIAQPTTSKTRSIHDGQLLASRYDRANW